MAVPLTDLDPDAFLRRGDWDRAALTRALADAANAAGLARNAMQRTALLADDRVAIVTGQQPAVGGGPLYSLVKTAHAIALARRLGSRAVPVFWCASEDHDLGEAGHADLIARDGTLHRYNSDLGGGRASLRFRPADGWWDGLVTHCQTHLGGGLGSTWLEQQRPRTGESTGAWTVRLLMTLFARFGLVGVEGHHLRPLWTTTLRRALDTWPATELASTRQAVLSSGCADAFGELAEPPLFADRATGRVALNVNEARALLADDPSVLSPGAALRPILQQAALPTVAYVAGPGELAYHRFITPLYAALAVPTPVLIPRCSLTLVPTWIQRACARWQVTLDDLAGAAPNQATTATTTLAGLDAALAVLTQMNVSPAQRRRLDTGVTRLRRERDRLAGSLARAERQAAERPAWGALQGFLHPRGGRQERTLSLFQAVWQFGPGIADNLVEAAACTAPGVHGWAELR